MEDQTSNSDETISENDKELSESGQFSSSKSKLMLQILIECEGSHFDVAGGSLIISFALMKSHSLNCRGGPIPERKFNN